MATTPTTPKSGMTAKPGRSKPKAVAAGPKTIGVPKTAGKSAPTVVAKSGIVTKDKPKLGVTTKSPERPKVTPIRAPTFKIETAYSKARYIKLLVYGDYGSGKTWLTSTSVAVREMQDVLMIDAEAGDMTLLDDTSSIDFAAIETVRVRNFKQVAHVQEFLKTHCRLREEAEDFENLLKGEAVDKLRELEALFKGIDPSDIEKPKRYRTVIIDSLTEVESYCMYQLLGVTELTRLDEEVASAEWSEYKKNHSMIQRLVRGFRDLPMHVLFTCASQYSQDETKRMLYSPALTGKLSRQIQGFMDVVGYLQTGTAESEEAPIPRRLYVQPVKGRRFAAKCRFSSFKGSYFENATMSTILKTVGLSLATSKPKPKVEEGTK